MVLSKTSWHFKLNKLLYGKHSKAPRNFCPYFWKSIVLGLILIIPLTVIAIPMMIFKIVAMKIDPDSDAPASEDNGYFSSYIFMCIFMNIALFSLYSMVAVWWSSWEKDHASVVQIFGILGYAAVIITILVFIRSHWIDWRYAKRIERTKKRHAQYYNVPYVPKEDKPNVFIEFVKSWYKKHCPLIDWK